MIVNSSFEITRSLNEVSRVTPSSSDDRRTGRCYVASCRWGVLTFYQRRWRESNPHGPLPDKRFSK